LLDRAIVLLTPEEHTLYDQGTREQRERYAKECEDNGAVAIGINFTPLQGN